MNDHFRDLRIALDENLLSPTVYPKVHTALNAIEQEMSDLLKQVKESRDIDFYVEFQKLLAEAQEEWGFEDEADALAELIDGAHFEYDTYVNLPQKLEEVLESKSEQRHYFEYEHVEVEEDEE